MATLVLADMSLDELERTFGPTAAAGVTRSRNASRTGVRTRRSAPRRLGRPAAPQAQELVSGQDA